MGRIAACVVWVILLALQAPPASAQPRPQPKHSPRTSGKAPDLSKLPPDSLARLEPAELARRVDETLWYAERAGFGAVTLEFHPPHSAKDLPSYENVSFRFLWTAPSERFPHPDNSALEVQGLPRVWRFREDLLESDFSFAVYPFLNRPLASLLDEFHMKVLPNQQDPHAAQVLLTPLDPDSSPLIRRRIWLDDQGIPQREEATSRLAARTLTEFEYRDIADGRHLLVRATTRDASQPQAAPAVFEYLYDEAAGQPIPKGVRLTLRMKETTEILYEHLEIHADIQDQLEAARKARLEAPPRRGPSPVQAPPSRQRRGA